MARARNIKPGLFKNELLGVADPLLTVLFVGLWCIADREGRLEDRPLRIKAEVFAYREGLDINRYLTELERLAFIRRYEVAGERYIQVLNFLKHQNPHNTEKKSELPEMPAKSASCPLTVTSPLSNGCNPADSLIPDSLIPSSLIPESLITIQEQAHVDRRRPTSAEAAPVLEVFEYWKRVMDHPRTVLDKAKVKAIKGRLADGYTVGDLCKAIDGCKYDPFSQGANDRQTVYDNIGLICRDGLKVDHFIAIAERGPPTGRPANVQQTIDNLQAYLSEHEN